MSNYTINDAFKNGFEDGLRYLLRYIRESGEIPMTEDDILDLAQHLEKWKRWRDLEGWLEWIHRNA